MERARLGEQDASPVDAAVVVAEARDALAAEMRHSALLLGWTLGLMGGVALLLLLLTTRFGS